MSKKKKRVMSDAQKAAMKAGRDRAKAAKLAESDIPTGSLGDGFSPDGLAAPTPTEEVTEIDDNEVPASAPLQAPTAFTQEQLMTMMLQMQQQIIQLKTNNPQAAQATPDQKIEEISTRLTPHEANRARITKAGVQGQVFRYPLEKSYYPDPTERLLNESRLARFAMKENYIFKWSVDGENYEKNGVSYAEPRFTLELYHRMWDDEGEPMRNPKTGKPVASLVARNMQHEDEFTTRVAAQNLELLDKFSDDDDGFRLLMDEVRYWRMQQWLFAIFTPPKITTFKSAPRQQIINGKVVEVYDTEELTDRDTGISQASTLQTQAGIGGIPTPDKG